MIISSSITIGQITFVLRVAIQILSYVGLAIIGTLILGSVPRVASISTHDTLNRVVGGSSATSSTIKWIISRVRRNPADPHPPTNLLLILFLSLAYTIFVSLSDVGFLGFYACAVPGPTISSTPASITSLDNAKSFISSNMINGTDLSTMKAYHCDSSTPTNLTVGSQTLVSCDAWHNGTYADEQMFSAMNLTDSDAMMPRQLGHSPYRDTAPYLNIFFLGPTTRRIVDPIVANGMVIVPHSMGVQMVVGVPQLAPDTMVQLDGVMAIEAEVGCMTLGIFDASEVFGIGITNDYMHTNGSWRKYSGPDYMEEILGKTVDDIRSYFQTFFNASSLNENGTMTSFNASDDYPSIAAHVEEYFLPTHSFSETNPTAFFMGNCTEALQRKLGIPIGGDNAGSMCSLLGIGGTETINAVRVKGFQRMVCATATQVNMVDASVQVNNNHNVSLSLTRLPSDLNYVKADFWDIYIDKNNSSQLDPYLPYERYTLTPNPNSPTSHYIRHRRIPLNDNQHGQGSAGNAISAMGSTILASDSAFSKKRYSGLMLLDEGIDEVDTTPEKLTKWVGQVGGSYLLGSLSYNGLAALHSTPIAVISTGGHVGSCYKPYYALGFIPFLFSATVLICWGFILLLRGSWSGTRLVKEVYGGTTPYSNALCPGEPPSKTLLSWESSPQPRLQVISPGYIVTGDANGTALKHLKTTPAYPGYP